jgi:hypothetical protein
MRWNNKRPALGDTRDRIKFAFLPRKVGQGTTIWLERYLSIQQYIRVSKELYKPWKAKNMWVEYMTSVWAGNRHTIITNR